MLIYDLLHIIEWNSDALKLGLVDKIARLTELAPLYPMVKLARVRLRPCLPWFYTGHVQIRFLCHESPRF